MTITIQPVPYQTILNQNIFEKHLGECWLDTSMMTTKQKTRETNEPERNAQKGTQNKLRKM